MQGRDLALVLAVVVVMLTRGVGAAWGGGENTRRGSWESLSAEEKARAREHFLRFQKLPEGDRQRVEGSYQRWQALSPDQRARVRKNYDSYRDLDRGAREHFDRTYRDWQSGHRDGGATTERRGE
jgi:hypothetical protein